MRQRLLLTPLSLVLAAAFGSGPAMALGFARAQPVVTLGAPLDISVGLRLDAGEILQPECISAEVTIGDAPVARDGVSAVLEAAGGQPSIRVRTLQRIDEPVVIVGVTAGCDGKVTRRYTLFADPPGLPGSVPAVVAPEPVALPLVADPAAAAATPAATVAASALSPAEVGPAAAPRGQVRTTQPSTSVRPARPASSAASPPMRRVAKSDRPATPARAGARLQLEAPAATAARQALAEATERYESELATARAALGVAQAAAEAASARMVAVETSLEALKKDSQAQREEMARLQRTLADTGARERWIPALLVAVLALAGLAGWLYRRLRQAEARRAQEWWTSAQAEAGPGVDGMAGIAPAGAAAAATLASAPTPAPPATAGVSPGSGTQARPVGRTEPDSPLRDASIEELLDVEQQAEFFLVLGQDDAAVELLVGHLGAGGAASPLPYLRLLEIHHRRGDPASYEQWRLRFNERFKVQAPAWSDDLSRGRTLEDYPALLARLQQAWPQPAQAMAQVEILLFHGDSGQPLDLPAYRDLLFLFTIARDLQEPRSAEDPAVDLLLPFATAGDSLPPLELAPREARPVA